MLVCAYSGCDNEFEPNAKRSKKYCSYECSVKANNQRAMEKYNERKRLLQEPQRKCATVGCPTILRRTNTGKYCDPCLNQRQESEKKGFRDMVLGNG
jgi:hypothetical protein